MNRRKICRESKSLHVIPYTDRKRSLRCGVEPIVAVPDHPLIRPSDTFSRAEMGEDTPVPRLPHLSPLFSPVPAYSPRAGMAPRAGSRERSARPVGTSRVLPNAANVEVIGPLVSFEVAGSRSLLVARRESATSVTSLKVSLSTVSRAFADASTGTTGFLRSGERDTGLDIHSDRGDDRSPESLRVAIVAAPDFDDQSSCPSHAAGQEKLITDARSSIDRSRSGDQKRFSPFDAVKARDRRRGSLRGASSNCKASRPHP